MAPVTAPKAPTTTTGPSTSETPTSTSEEAFREAALGKGLTTYAINGLLDIIDGDFAKGIATVNKKTAEQVEGLNQKFAPKSEGDDGSQW